MPTSIHVRHKLTQRQRNCSDMNSEIASDLRIDFCSQPRQLSLFALDPWGAAYAFEVVDHPTAGISRAMIGPLSLGSSYKPAKIKCLATTEDGDFAAAIWIDQPPLEDPKALWEKVEKKLVVARHAPIALNSMGLRLGSDDCVKNWIKTELWDALSTSGKTVPRCVHSISKLLRFHEFGKEIFVDDEALKRIEVKALAMLREQLCTAVRWVIGGLGSALDSILINRPSLSMALANRIVSRAKQHGPTAVVYALQALRTESIGVLHLIASGQPEIDAQRVQDALFNGHSVPDTFANLGVAKSTHRRTVLRPIPCPALPHVPIFSLSNLPMAGRDWLFAMRLTTLFPFHRSEDFLEFGRLLNQIQAIDFQRVESAPRLLQWCISPGYAKSCVRLNLLMNFAQALIRACRRLVGARVTIDEAVSATLHWVKNLPAGVRAGTNFSEALDPDDHAMVLAGVSLITSQPIKQLTHSLFKAHPGLSSNVQMPEFLTFQALNSLDLAILHGKACNNCLQYPSTVLNYVIEGVALYGVHTKAGVAGTIALRYDRTERYPKVEVQEVTGINNAPAVVDLCRLAQCLADSWTTAEQEANWTAYEDQCSHWRSLLDG